MRRRWTWPRRPSSKTEKISKMHRNLKVGEPAGKSECPSSHTMCRGGEQLRGTESKPEFTGHLGICQWSACPVDSLRCGLLNLMPVQVSNHSPSSIPSGQGGHSGYFSVPCAGGTGSWWCWIRHGRELLQQAKWPWNGKLRNRCQDGMGYRPQDFQQQWQCVGLYQREHKFIIPDFHSEHQPRKQRWAQDQNCHLPAEASVNRGTRLKSEASSPPRPWCHKRTFLPHPHAPNNIPGSVWENTDQTRENLLKVTQNETKCPPLACNGSFKN